MGINDKTGLSRIIEPEIFKDELYSLIVDLLTHNKLYNLIEIGASSGNGSTEAIITGLRAGSNRAARVFAIELSKERHRALSKRWSGEPQLNAIYGSSIDIYDFPSIEQVTSMWNEGETKLSNLPICIVLNWYKQDLDYMIQNGQTTSSIKQIKKLYQIKDFDFALIDGSEFTGLADFQLLYGSKFITLDDITTYKCFQARNILAMDEGYVLISENINLRNGYAAFKRVE